MTSFMLLTHLSFVFQSLLTPLFSLFPDGKFSLCRFLFQIQVSLDQDI